METGPSTGTIPLGILSMTSMSLSITSCLAKYTLVVSVKTKVTNESEFLFKDLMSVRPGNPVIEISIGMVINRSTSSGDFPGA